jgi:16S rRNA (uracil1498-N3)-methyltransferase
MREGAQLVVFNGEGAEYLAELRTVSKTGVEAQVLERRTVNREAGREVTIASPLPKGDRAQFLIEKLTELGVYRYIPVITQRSIVNPGEGKTDKLRRYVIEASKQCGRNVLMQVDTAVAWSDLVARADLPESRLVADPAGQPIAKQQSEGCMIAVGPEGGFTDEEILLATQHAWRLVGIGKSILRIETAALAAAALALHAG